MSPKLILFGKLLFVWLVPMGAYAQSGGSAGSNRPAEINKALDIKSMPEFFDYYCVRCHGGTKSEGDLTLQDLALVPAESWQRIGEVINSAEMPPESEMQPSASLKNAALVWISKKLQQVSPRKPRLRRMSRFEYEKTVQDLLGIDLPLADYLPEDAVVQGFDNVSTGLAISATFLESYLAASNAAFESCIRRVPPMAATTRRSVLVDLPLNQQMLAKKQGGVIASEGAFVDFDDRFPEARVDQAHPLEPGVYRWRIALWPHNPGNRTLSVAIYSGALYRNGERTFEGLFDVTGDNKNPCIIELTTKMVARDGLHILPRVYPEHITYRDKGEPRPGIAILWAESSGPIDQEFPAAPQVRLFGNSPTLTMVPGESIYMRHRKDARQHFVGSSEPEADIQRILSDFIPKAFRRPVDKELENQFVQLALGRLGQGSTFEQSVQAGVTAVLCSPHFLLLNQHPSDDYTLASRLSYFLWSSMPDDQLLQLAADGRLSDRDVRYAQVERMLNDPKAERFVRHFTDLWLDLQNIDFTRPDKTLYPEYDDILLYSLGEETRGFFRHLLKEDLSALNFIDSDFAILNQRLADHYGISGVVGHEKFQAVPLPATSERGGLLAQGSVLKVSANGTNTSPVIRGAWVLDRLLGHPSPPPPAGVPAVEPDIRGATTIREQLARHQEDDSCSHCHRRIDPHGWALEEFDVIGGYREHYRVTEGDRRKRVNKYRYFVGSKVEADGKLADGAEFSNFHEYRQRLVSQPDAIVRALATKLLIYSCGCPVTASDHASVQSILDTTRDGGHGLRAMIHAVTDTELFLR